MNSRENKNSIDFILFWQILKNMLRSYHFCGIPFVKHFFFAMAFKKIFYLFIYLAVLGLSCGMWDLVP